MTKYTAIVPEDINSNTFDFHSASIEITSDKLYYSRYKSYMYFLKTDDFPTTVNTPPPISYN